MDELETGNDSGPETTGGTLGTTEVVVAEETAKGSTKINGKGDRDSDGVSPTEDGYMQFL